MRCTAHSDSFAAVSAALCLYAVEATDFDRARKIAERALKTIHFRADKEKFNVWVAMLNLENLYGTPDTLAKLIERAVAYNDPVRVHSQLAKIYEATGKTAAAVETYDRLVRKYHSRAELWHDFAAFHFRRGAADDGRAVFKRALERLPQSEHANAVCGYAALEFGSGVVDRGRTLLDGVVTNYPKRSDVWSRYADLELRHLRALRNKHANAKAAAGPSPAAALLVKQAFGALQTQIE
jgi:rRNA biogenesis protein RRP5